MTFGARLVALVAQRESQIVLGLDPDPARLWPEALEHAPADGSPARRAAAAVRAHCAALIDAAGPACVAVKPQLACFERLGADGWAALAATVEHAHAAGLLVIADAKRGDIDVSAAAYAQALVGSTPTPFGDVPGLGADAFTANPLLGVDALEPFAAAARAAGAGIFVLVRTSNPGAADVEDLALDGGRDGLRAPGRDRRPPGGARRRALARSARSWARPSPRISRACASSCRARRSCCPASAPRAGASRTWPPRSRPAPPADSSARRARSPAHTRRQRRDAHAARAEAERLREVAWSLA